MKAKSNKKSQSNKSDSDNKVSLAEALHSSTPINDKKTLSEVYLNIYESQRGFSSAYFKAKLCNASGEPISPIKMKHEYSGSKPSKIKEVDEVALYGNGLVDLMRLIQTGELGHFSSITMYAQEKTVSYSDHDLARSQYRSYYTHTYTGPPPNVTPIQGAHYYLDLILGKPGTKVKLSRARKVKACKACDRMLLRYTYNWRLQRDDLKEKICPYCGKPLEIIERERKYVEVALNFDAKDCEITGTNNQIGVYYYGQPIKATVKVAALRNFLMNFQLLFPNNVIGPLDVNLNIVRSRKGFNFIDAVEASELIGDIEWRPAVLFPEDLIAF